MISKLRNSGGVICFALACLLSISETTAMHASLEMMTQDGIESSFRQAALQLK